MISINISLLCDSFLILEMHLRFDENAHVIAVCMFLMSTFVII